MIVLAFETVTPAGSMALWRDGVLTSVEGDRAVAHAVRLPAGDYDIALFAWVASVALASNNSIYLPAEQGGGQNWNGYVNDKIVELSDAADSELDEAKRADIYNQMDQIIWDDMVTIPLTQWTELYANAGTVSGIAPNSFAGVTWNAETWTK